MSSCEEVLLSHYQHPSRKIGNATFFIQDTSTDMSGVQEVTAPTSLCTDVSLKRGVIQLRTFIKDNILHIDVLSGSQLERKDTSGHGRSDPYVILRLGDLKQKTKHINGTLEPTWNQTFLFPIKGELDYSKRLFVEVWDWDRLSKDDFMGSMSLEVSEITEDETDQWYILLSQKEGKTKYLLCPEEKRRRTSSNALNHWDPMNTSWSPDCEEPSGNGGPLLNCGGSTCSTTTITGETDKLERDFSEDSPNTQLQKQMRYTWSALREQTSSCVEYISNELFEQSILTLAVKDEICSINRTVSNQAAADSLMKYIYCEGDNAIKGFNCACKSYPMTSL